MKDIILLLLFIQIAFQQHLEGIHNYLLICDESNSNNLTQEKRNEYEGLGLKIVEPLERIDANFLIVREGLVGEKLEDIQTDGENTDGEFYLELNFYVYNENQSTCALKRIEFKEKKYFIDALSFQIFDEEQFKIQDESLKSSDFVTEQDKYAIFTEFQFNFNHTQRNYILGIIIENSENHVGGSSKNLDYFKMEHFILRHNRHFRLDIYPIYSEYHHIQFIDNEVPWYGCAIMIRAKDVIIMNDWLMEDNYKLSGTWYGLMCVYDSKSVQADGITWINNSGFEQMLLTTQNLKGHAVYQNLLLKDNHGASEFFLVRNNRDHLVEFLNLTMIGNSIDQKGMIRFYETAKFRVQNFTIINNRSVLQTGILIFNLYKSNEFEFTDGEFYDNYCLGYAGGFYAIDSSHATFTNIYFQGNTATQSGVGFHAENGEDFKFENVVFKGNNPTITEEESFNAYGLMRLQSISDIKINNCKFIGNRGVTSSSIYLLEADNFLITNSLFKNNNYFSGIGGITVGNSDNIKLINNEFINNIQPNKVGAIDLVTGNTNVLIDQCTFNGNSAISEIGAIQIQGNTNIVVQNSYFSDNYALEKGVMSIVNSNNVKLKNIQLIENQAKKIGGIYIQSCQKIKILSSNFVGNSAVMGIGVMDIQQSKNILLNHNNFRENSTEQNIGALQIYFCDGEINIENGEFISNSSVEGYGGAALFSQNSSIITLKQIVFEKNFSKLQGGAIYAIRQSELLFEENTFKENTSIQQGGTIYAYNSGTINFSNSKFLKNYSEEQGACIYFDKIEKLIAFKTYFQNHQSARQGGVLYSIETDIIEFNQVVMTQNGALEEGGCLVIDKTNEIIIKDSEFQYNSAQIQGGFANIIHVGSVKFEQTILKNSKIKDIERVFPESSPYGEQYSIYMNDENSSLSQQQIKLMKIAGAIYFKKIEYIKIDNSNISENQATYKGGAFYMQDVDYIIIQDSSMQKNKLELDQEEIIFDKNQLYFLSQGGAIFLSQIQQEYPQISIINSQLNGNEASSGGGILIYNGLDSHQRIYIQQEFDCQYNVADHGPCMRYFGPDNKNITKTFENFESQHINYGIITKSNYKSSFQINEKRNSEFDYEYELCPPGTYLKKGGSLICEKCVENGKCDGGYIPVYPQQGYWRDMDSKYDFIYCDKYPGSCLGNDTCKEGYIGLKCENCDSVNDYERSGIAKCSKCQDMGLIILKIVLLFLAVLLLMSKQLYNSIVKTEKLNLVKTLKILYRYPYEYKNISTGIFNILIMHCQIMILISQIDVQIPFQVIYSLEIFGNPHKTLSNSVQCLDKIESLEEIIEQGQRLKIYGLSFLVLALASMIFIIILRYFDRKQMQKIEYRKRFWSIIVSTVIIFFIMTQPGILQSAVNFIVCEKIGDKSYNLEDSNLLCDENFYKYTVLPINLIILLIFAFVIPGILLAILRQAYREQRLSNIFFSRKFCLLYINSKNNFFFWEILVILEKITIVFIATLFQKQEMLRGVILILIVQVFLQMCSRFKPFKDQKLNDLFIYMCYIQTFTIVGSLIIHQQNILDPDLQKEERSNTIQILTVVLVMTINVIFITFAVYLLFRDFIQANRILIIDKIPFIADKFKLKSIQRHNDLARRNWLKLRKIVTHKKYIIEIEQSNIETYISKKKQQIDELSVNLTNNTQKQPQIINSSQLQSVNPYVKSSSQAAFSSTQAAFQSTQAAFQSCQPDKSSFHNKISIYEDMDFSATDILEPNNAYSSNYSSIKPTNRQLYNNSNNK